MSFDSILILVLPTIIKCTFTLNVATQISNNFSPLSIQKIWTVPDIFVPAIFFPSLIK